MDDAKLARNEFAVIVLTLISLLGLFILPRVSQDQSYHNFADQREIFGIPHFLNVITNVPFAVIGFVGMLVYFKQKNHDHNSLPYFTLFIGVIGIALGSGWYHYNPTNETLLWDRVPMTVTFMSYFSIVIGRYVNRRLGAIILMPLLLVGIFSVWYWFITEKDGVGDLRLYAWVQFYPMLCIPLILFLYPASKRMRLGIGSVIMVYIIAKLAEDKDETIFSVGYLISGHSLKHMFASLSVLFILLTLRDEKLQQGIHKSPHDALKRK